MKNAFIDSNGVLTAFGYQVANNTDDRVEVPDDFQMPIGRSRHQDGQWIEFEPPTPVPAVISMRQARLALLAAGKLAAVATAIAALPLGDKEVAQIEWDYAATVERASPLIAVLASKIGLDGPALDEMFIAAAEL